MQTPLHSNRIGLPCRSSADSSSVSSEHTGRGHNLEMGHGDKTFFTNEQVDSTLSFFLI